MVNIYLNDIALFLLLFCFSQFLIWKFCLVEFRNKFECYLVLCTFEEIYPLKYFIRD